ncbi:hypothetical protein AAF712_007107 [Marasmius tenuissimus]|uniref:Uncharacterized protein n=1 Tax=Marasmius tenuissimus TaxID=585030 RepID=A0ABR2ZXJ4_9AGAR
MALEEEDNLRLSKEELEFYKQQLGMEDEAEIKDHIVEVGTRAHKVFNYGCISLFLFVKYGRSSLYLIKRIRDLITEHSDSSRKHTTLRNLTPIGHTGALWNRAFNEKTDCMLTLDVAQILVTNTNLVGADLRKAIVDGLPVQKAIGSDIRREFWGLGHELFKSTPETFPATFIPGDAFDKSFISGRGPCAEAPTGSLPDLKTLTSFIPLQGRVTAIHVANVFHLFSKEKQLELAQALSSLLSPVPGSVIFGSQAGKEVPGEYTNRRGETSFAHSPESWKELWDGGVFPAGSIRVKTKLYPIPFAQKFGIEYALFWSCTVV